MRDMTCVMCNHKLIKKSDWVVRCPQCGNEYGGIYHQTQEDEHRGEVEIGSFVSKGLPKVDNVIGYIIEDYEVILKDKEKYEMAMPMRNDVPC